MTSFIYPIRLDVEVKYVPRSMIAAHDEQCRINHGCSLEEMENRHGGLTPEEAMAVMEDREFARMPLSVARRRLQELSSAWMHGHNKPDAQAHLNSQLDLAVQRLEHMRDGITLPSRSLFNMVLDNLAVVRELLK